MTTRIHTNGFLAALLLSATVPALALAAESRINPKTESLVCGNSVLTVQTTFLRNKGQSTQVLAQRMTLKNEKTNQLKELPTDGRYVIRHVPDKRKVLDAAIQILNCIKASNGKYYFETFYYCPDVDADDDWKGICIPKSVHIEWTRYLREDGTMLYKSPRHWTMKREEEALYRRLGLFDDKRIIRSKDLLADE